jgi:GWxTD domain-containing protein
LRRAVGIQALVTTCLLATSAVAARAEQPASVEFPLRSSGDIHFDLDRTIFFRPGSLPHTELHLRIPNGDLKFAPTEDNTLQAELALDVVATDSAGARVQLSRKIPVLVSDRSAATSMDQVQLLTAPIELQPGRYSLTVNVTDRKAVKRGFLYMLKRKLRSGRVQTTLVVPPRPQAGSLALSGLQFAWRVVRPAEDSPEPPRVIPNPSRTYGLYLSTLAAYLEIYDAVDTNTTTYYIDAAVLASSGDTVTSSRDTVLASGPAFGRILTEDISSAAAGRYTYSVNVRRADGRGTSSVAGAFDVIWQGTSWSTVEQDQLDVARLLLPEDQFARFARLSLGERETYLATFWKEHDPTPSTAFNELRAEFERRIQFANARFGVLGKGILSDRGKIYVRLGEPDEISTHTQPLNRETIQNELQSTRSGQELLGAGVVPRVEEGERNRPFVVWTYDRGGHPLFAEQRIAAHPNGLTFVFVDEQGWGDFILRYTTEATKY